MACKFINIQQSTKTKFFAAPLANGVSLSISNRVLKLSFLANLAGGRVSLSISNRVLKPLPAKSEDTVV